MENLTNKNLKDVVEGSDVEGSMTSERSGNAEKNVEGNIERENEVEWEKGSLLDYCQEGEYSNSRRSSPIPGPEDFEEEEMELEGYRYGKRRYSQHFDFDYMPLSDPEEDFTAPPKLNTARRGKARPSPAPAPMHTVGLEEAMREYEALKAKRLAEEEEEKKKKEGGVATRTRSKGKGRGKKTATEFHHFLEDANRFAEEILEESRRNPVQVPREVTEQVERELRARKEIEEEVDRELQSTVEREPVAGPSQPIEASVPGTAEPLTGMDLGGLDDRPIDDLKAVAATKLSAILTVASKSGNLQGRYVRDLKDAAKSLREVVECLAVRPDGEELRRLKTANHNLRRELEELKREMKEMRREMRDRRSSPPRPAPPPPPPAPQTSTSDLPPALRDFNPEEFLEKVQRMVAVTCGTIVTARIEALGLPPPPIVRPPLAVGINREGPPAVTPVEPQESWATVTRRGKKGKGKKTIAPSAVATAVAPAATPSGSLNAPSSTVSAPVLPSTTAAPVAPKPAARQKPRIVAPRSSAVVITLEPDAIQRGITYRDALTQARKSVSLEEFTVDRVSTRQTATGARIIELFGPDSGAKADDLAAKLKEKLVGVAKVTRPTKCTDVRIVGLDDSIEKAEIISVVAGKSGCSEDQLKMGEVRPGPRGGTVVVSIPSSGAKKLLEAGRLLIGWSSALVQALDPRPLRCFKCMGVGHTRQLCPSPFDRSDICFRCGCFGHKAAGCFEEARCAVCEDANRPFRHTMGGRDCNPPPVKGKVVTPAVSRPVQHDDEEREDNAMSVQNTDRDSLDEE